MSKPLVKMLLGVTLALAAVSPGYTEEKAKAKSVVLDIKVEESEAKESTAEPNFGYEGCLGSFAATKSHGVGLIVVHSYPDTSKKALAHTRLTFEGAKRLGNVDGWVFKTDLDGSKHPSKVFFSSEKVYFGAGINEYIAADYREKSGWVWKLTPMRRMELAKPNGAEKAAATEK